MTLFHNLVKKKGHLITGITFLNLSVSFQLKEPEQQVYKSGNYRDK